MKKAAIRAFRARGHVSPRVAVEVHRERLEDPDGPRTVTLRTEAGRRRSLAALEIAGLDPADARLVVARFPGTLARAELAAGRADADATLRTALVALGYPEARIATRFVSGDGSRLVVGVDPGPRQSVAAVRIEGVEGEDRERLLALVPLRASDPARRDLVARHRRGRPGARTSRPRPAPGRRPRPRDLVACGELLVEGDLQAGGYADAQVRSRVTPLLDRAGQVEVVYDVEPGLTYRLTRVAVAGERWTRPGLLLREAGLATGQPLVQASLDQARARLYQTGVFSRVEAQVEKGADGGAQVTFSLTESPRFRFGYGLRYESSVGAGAVLDAVDQNFLGRAITLGLRGLYQDGDRSGRLYLQTGGVLGTRISLESYLQVRRQITHNDDSNTDTVEDTREAALQASRPLGALHHGAALRPLPHQPPVPNPPGPVLPLRLRGPPSLSGSPAPARHPERPHRPRRGLLREPRPLGKRHLPGQRLPVPAAVRAGLVVPGAGGPEGGLGAVGASRARPALRRAGDRPRRALLRRRPLLRPRLRPGEPGAGGRPRLARPGGRGERRSSCSTRSCAFPSPST